MVPYLKGHAQYGMLMAGKYPPQFWASTYKEHNSNHPNGTVKTTALLYSSSTLNIMWHIIEEMNFENHNGMETSTLRSGIGKTPLSRSLAMAISEYVIDRDETEGSFPSYRCGNHLDFFRGTPTGFVAQPCIYDDGDTPSGLMEL